MGHVKIQCPNGSRSFPIREKKKQISWKFMPKFRERGGEGECLHGKNLKWENGN